MTSKQTPDVIHSDRLRQLAESRKQILGLPADKALAAIVKHPQPAALVHSFPEADLHFLLHDIGLDNALPLLALASNRQWEYLMDMEIWNRDQLKQLKSCHDQHLSMDAQSGRAKGKLWIRIRQRSRVGLRRQLIF